MNGSIKSETFVGDSAPSKFIPIEPRTKFSKRGALRGPQFLEGGKGVVAIFK